MCALSAVCCVLCACVVLCSVYRELDYADMPVPKPTTAEFEVMEERVRDAVIDQVYHNPITYPERMSSAFEREWGVVVDPLHSGPVKEAFGDAQPSTFAKPLWQAASQRKMATNQNAHSYRSKMWLGRNLGWAGKALSDAEHATHHSKLRNR
jgi:hypothetical protein